MTDITHGTATDRAGIDGRGSASEPTPARFSPSRTAIPSTSTTIEIVVPAHNEERALPGCLRTLHARLRDELPYPWHITVVDNASTDRTLEVARELAAELPRVRVVHLDRKGKGLAVRTVWGSSEADIVAYMDVDLSTGLDGFLPLIAPLVSGHSDLAIGSRLAPGARTLRGLRREFVSRSYNALIRFTHGVRFSDGQCGFKAARTRVIRPLLEVARDDRFFFDTELLLLADHNGLRVHEVAVDWVEDVDTRVNIMGTAMRNVLGLWRMARLKATGRARAAVTPRPGPVAEHPNAVLRPRAERGVLTREVGYFLAIGLASTIGHALLYWLLRFWWSPPAANLVALVALTVLNTEAHRRLTFRGAPAGPVRAHVGSVVLFVLGYAMTTSAVLCFRHLADEPSHLAEVVTLAAASAVVTVVRFLALKLVVFGRHRVPASP
ncbi:glycosyltransferase [Streptomyces alkaliphilus]|uniref:dolichyl-phosphate beta-glucosyltransferase n=1 Tax=Streptomyces alkaliphilus TaxID=1472722 RepID=A0A7W3XZX4_9ACTN|nr:bifunctional glycosyltransferase family 2/GtrA family protein [Streptomyces alkaliphilus]MBB0242803.1 glycosyltransferase [Streptomyces alkaliphilus]